MCLCVRFTTCSLRISFHSAFRHILSGRAPHCSGIALWTAGRSPIALYYRTIKTHFGICRLPSCNYVPQNALDISVLKLCSLRPSRSTIGGWAPTSRPDCTEGLTTAEPDVSIRMIGWRSYETTRRHIPYCRNIVIFSEWWQFILQYQFRPLVSLPLPCWLSCRYLLTPPLSGVWLWPRVNCHLCAPRHLGRGVSTNSPPSE
jgi:hypothetical protein